MRPGGSPAEVCLEAVTYNEIYMAMPDLCVVADLFHISDGPGRNCRGHAIVDYRDGETKGSVWLLKLINKVTRDPRVCAGRMHGNRAPLTGRKHKFAL